MREIKFRAWHKKEKYYAIVSSLIYQCSGITLEGGRYGRHSALRKDVVVEQYTGLKDKNKKEIYEGDYKKHPFYGVGVVKFGAFLCGNSEGNYCGWYVEYGNGITFPLSGDMNFEIIGNIHENKELSNDEV